MAFEQYTRCIAPANFVPRSYAVMFLQAALVASVPFALAVGHPICLIIAAEIMGLAFVIAYCRNWLYGRLICLGADKPVDRSVIGALVSVSPPNDLAVDWDTDYSINLLLQCTNFGVEQADAVTQSPYGDLIAHQDVIENPPVSRETPGHFGVDKNGTGLESWGLHAEFEGAGNYHLMQLSEGMLGMAVALFIACLFAPFPIDLIISIFIALGFLLGAIASKYARPGSPADTNPDLSEFHTNTTQDDGTVRGADILYLEGTWVYDSLHQGWNEIHPIKVCTKIGTWEGDWSGYGCGSSNPGVILRLQEAFQQARAEETLASQARPEHQWRFHPHLDGCSRDVIL